jgi:uncharacterized repeat protein (TIGR02543 family)
MNLVLKTRTSRFVSSALAAILAVGNLVMISSPAQAISVDASAAAFDFNFATKGTLLSGASRTADGAVVKYTNITGTPMSGLSIDAIVTTTTTSSTVTVYDSPGSASGNTDYFQVDGGTNDGGTMAFTFDFYESGTYTGVGTGIPITLQNVSVTSIDLDGQPTFCQFTDFTGFQRYFLGEDSNLDVLTNADDATIPVGVTRFIAKRIPSSTACAANNNLVEDAFQVQYDSVTSFTAKFGTDRDAAGGYFGIAFKPLSAVFSVTQPAGFDNPANQPPTSSNTTRTVTSGEPSVIQLADFGDFQDPDSNPFVKVRITALPASGSLQKLVNGNWVSVSLSDEILVSDITNGHLRYTGTSDSSLQFKVSDGGTSYSTSAYTLTLLVAEQSQSITFNNPGTKLPTDPAFGSGATASSGLTVVLESLTPGVCTVSGLNITPVASGTCTIVASQSGNGTYSAASPVTQTFPISTLTPQTITAPNPGSSVYTGTPSTVTVSPTATSSLDVSLISLTPSVCTVSGFVITIVGPGNCTIRNVQPGDETVAPAPPVEYTFFVSSPITNYTVFYDGNQNSGGTAPDNQTGNGDVTLASNSGSLVRDGYVFKGWNTEPDGTGTPYSTSSDYNLVADITLYADWRLASEELADTGSDEVPVLPLALGLMAVGAFVRLRRITKS